MSTQFDDQLHDESEEAAPIDYRMLSALAIFGAAMAAFSILTIFHWLFWLIPLAAMYLCYLAIKQIRRVPTEYTGLGIARSGMAAAFVLALVGQIVGHYVQKNAIPAGYKVIKWDDLQTDPKKPAEIVPETAYDLEPSDKDRDRRVFISGYINLNMTDKTYNIRQFILVPRASDCKFCQAQIKSTEMILVNCVGGLSVDATGNEIRIGGKFYIDRNQAANPFGGLPYRIEADYVPD